jgi:hypothetical protein
MTAECLTGYAHHERLILARLPFSVDLERFLMLSQICRAVPVYDWGFSIYTYIVYLSYNIRYFVYFPYSRIVGHGGASRSPR